MRMVWYDSRKKLAKEFEESCIGLHAPHSPFNVISFLEGIGRLKDEEDVKVCEITANIPLDRLEAICNAEREGRCVVLPVQEEGEYGGLKAKYHVFKSKDNSPVENCFVLRPDKDPAAVAALTAYVKTTTNKQLAEDLLNWIEPDEKVVVLPCKVGDEVINNDIYNDRRPVECHVSVIKTVVWVSANGLAWGGCYELDDFGKTVFLTRAEAEAALQKGSRA